MEMWKHEDAAGDKLFIGPHTSKPATAFLTAAANGVEITPKDLPAFTGKLREACGLPSPVIPERSSARFPEDGSPFRFGGFGFRLRPEGVCPSLPGIEAKAVPPAALRELAAHLVALADDAEARPEPDPDEVDELAHAIRLGLFPGSDITGVRVGDGDRTAARAALRWMNAKAARHA